MLKILSILLLLIDVDSSLIIKCEYKKHDWKIIGSLYQCAVINEVSITLPETFIENVTRIQQTDMTENDVQAFTAKYKNINFIPYGLIESFPNLTAINIASCHLKEIHQKDIQNITNLKVLKLKDNDIEMIEKDLFKFNPNWLYIKLKSNKIKEIHPAVFKNLKKLHELDIKGNICCDTEEAISEMDV
ncbi:hypothetical protein PVAND_015491 [Polypedilum vanderplanki]|uniref:Uncharacterized protein n=1 Tax=Polypedilum vanderplanki TaxID=319348 RepID=A0A9J6BD58_POLVA|nr:hypothetical protein PVAND_015491 [Polypedilum vanderplanki]